MTEPLSVATRPNRQRRPIRTADAAPDRLRGRWPATDQLTGPAIATPTDGGGQDRVAAALVTGQLTQEAALSNNVVGDARQKLTPERAQTFADRMAAIDAHFSNPSTGETSVDRPLVTIDAHELNAETDAPAQRSRPSAPRLR